MDIQNNISIPFVGKKKLFIVTKIMMATGQLNFFQWAIRNKVIKYVKLHLKEIEHDMKKTSKENKEKKLIAMDEAIKYISEEEENARNDEPDPIICSSDKINSLHISPCKKPVNNKSDFDNKNKRQHLSESVFAHGIKKSSIPIKLDFD
jgi:hypothetical protein